MRERVDQLGVAEPEIQRSGSDQIAVALPGRQERRARPTSRSARPPSCTSTTGRRTSSARTASPTPHGPDVTGGRPPAGRAPARCRTTTRSARAAKCPAQNDARTARPTATRTTSSTQDRRQVARRPGRHPQADARPQTDGRRRRPRTSSVVDGQAGHGRRPGRAARTATTATRAPTQWYVLRDNPRSRARTSRTRSRTSTRARAATAADRHLRLHRQGPQGLAGRHARRSPSAARRSSSPGAAGRRAFQHFAIVLDNELDLGPVHRLPAEPGRHRRRATARRSRAASRSSRAQDLAEPPEDRRAADQARADLAVAGLGDARQAGAAPGPDRRPRRLRRRRAVPARLLPRARRDRGRRAGRLRASTSSR